MKCNVCGNNEQFTMIREIEAWDEKEKRFKTVENFDEYYVCDICFDKSEVGKHIDTEGDY